VSPYCTDRRRASRARHEGREDRVLRPVGIRAGTPALPGTPGLRIWRTLRMPEPRSATAFLKMRQTL